MQKAFATEVIMQMGLMSIPVDVAPIRETNSSKKVSFKSICPECETPTALTQQLHCDVHGHILTTDVQKARQTDEGLIRMSQEDMDKVAQVVIEFTTGVMQLQVCAAEELAQYTRPNEGAYRLRPGKKGTAQLYGVLLSMAQDPSKTLYGVAKLNGRTAPSPFRLEVWNGQLVLQSLIRPSDLAEMDDIAPAVVDENLVTLASQLLEANCRAFDPELLADARVEKLAEVMDAKAGVVTIQGPKVVVKPETDLMALLKQSIEAAKEAA